MTDFQTFLKNYENGRRMDAGWTVLFRCPFSENIAFTYVLQPFFENGRSQNGRRMDAEWTQNGRRMDAQIISILCFCLVFESGANVGMFFFDFQNLSVHFVWHLSVLPGLFGAFFVVFSVPISNARFHAFGAQNPHSMPHSPMRGFAP